MDFLDCIATPETYTFPATSLEPHKPQTVRMHTQAGSLGIVQDPTDLRRWEVVHTPTGKHVAHGNLKDMANVLAALLALPVNWDRVHLDAQEMQRAKELAEPIRESFY